MGEPILIDDGGSTRIKQLRGPGVTGRLDNLLEVSSVSGAFQSTDIAIGPFNQITISCLDETGAAAPPPGGAFPINITVNDTFTIFSDKHRVLGKIVNRSTTGGGTIADCELTVKGTAGIEPIVEARHSKLQRRYIISNAPPIEKVEVNAAGPAQSFNIPAGTVYTVVILMP